MIKPMYDRVLILPDPEETMSTGGIIIPDTAMKVERNDRTGTVVAVGPGKESPSGVLLPMESRVGDKVVYNKYSGTLVKQDGVEHLLTEEHNILVVLEGVN